ncbi:lysosomal/endosomal membrane protein p67, partial [Trypanosoma grayi]|uniref:lysosomal/endosomal membrane protein p67 n=1 Tax=Trypanosoma grayi TaxID=71804 RepID=UPI0004F43BB6
MATKRLNSSSGRLLSLLLLHLLVAVASLGVWAEVRQNGSATTVTVRYNATSKQFSATAGTEFGGVAATVAVNNTFLLTGWDVVTAEADAAFLQSGADAAQQQRLAYQALGYGEGYATQRQLAASMRNTFYGANGLNAVLQNSTRAVAWVAAHMEYMRNEVKLDDAYGQQLHNLLALLDGVVLGYNDNLPSPGDDRLNATWLFYLNFQTEIGDVVKAVSPAAVVAELRHRMPRYFADLHCSALVKVVRDDIYFSHVTWNSFNSMLRQYKTYKVGRRFVTMSSYPGVIHSIDDWYMTHARLAVMETTNGVFNDTLYTQHVHNRTVSEFLRVMIANFLAGDAPAWVRHFARENSGTYCNQWMVLDMGRVRDPGALLPPGTFVVAEQLPGDA